MFKVMNRKLKMYNRFFFIFIFFAIIVFALQMNREKRYKTDELRGKLLAYAEMSEGYLHKTNDTIALSKIIPPNIRFTLIDKNGKVLFDNVAEQYDKLDNHLERAEIIAAQVNGQGFSIRKSETIKTSYLYFAYRTQNNNFIRLALPYTVTFKDTVNKENLLLYILTIILSITLFVLFYRTEKFDATISELKKFAENVEKGNVDFANLKFPESNSGAIGQKIVRLYKNLEASKQETEKEKERNQAIKKELTNNIAHELKTPISSVLGYLESLHENKNIPEEKKQFFIERSYTQALRLSSLINDIATITKLEEASKLFIKEKINISEIAKEVFDELEFEIKKSNATIENSLPKSLIISGNRGLIFSIFRNLVENSLAYAGPNITIGLDTINPKDQEYFHFRFYDTGVSIKEHDLNKIFDRFVRLDQSRDRRTGGSGLGLSIVKHAVVFHGGTISVQNKKGGGLMFIFSIKI